MRKARETASEAPGSEDSEGLVVVGGHLAIEAMTLASERRITTGARLQLAGRGAHDGTPSVVNRDVETEIGSVHLSHPQPSRPPRRDRPACGSAARGPSRIQAECNAPSRRSLG